MIDFHSHILPGVDDGSSSVEESLKLLSLLSEQGVDTVVATPHFYPDRMSVEDFLKRREAAYKKLCECDLTGLPQIILGAEVKFYDSISRLGELELLCAGDSKTLLLEMPFSRWSEMTLKEVAALSRSGRVTVVLAHIERYLSFQTPDVWERILDSGVLTQVNASFFCGYFKKRKALNMLASGMINVIGSDCHNLTSRQPQIGKASEVIRKHFGPECLDYISEFTRELLCVSNKKVN
ncbi:MAG: capsular polysaccharide biosynthesis protein [Clostridia bacterium]|nr:capsular polysaccharide biosynthesis protein [Clostridia bacterium]